MDDTMTLSDSDLEKLYKAWCWHEYNPGNTAMIFYELRRAGEYEFEVKDGKVRIGGIWFDIEREINEVLQDG